MRTFGNAEPYDTFGYSVATDTSNSIYITGSTQTFGGENYNVFLQKYDQSCNLLYTKQWAGQGDDVARGITTDAFDNVYITGYTNSFDNGSTQIFLLKYTGFGDLLFSKIWGGVKNDYGAGVVADNLGNVYVVGTTNSLGAGGSDVVLLKYDSSGNLLYQKTWGGTQNDFGTGVAVDAGGYVYVTGYTYSLGPTPGIASVFLLKYDPFGNLLFQKTWGGIKNDFATGITVDLDGNVYVTGYTKSYSITPGVPSAFLLKFDQSGNLLFMKVWGGNRGDFAYSVAVDAAENVYVTGYTYSFGPNTQGTNFFILKYDSSGNLLFQKLYGGGIPDP
jgi:Beta-propeller repeat